MAVAAIECVVIGAGVVGLAIARSLSRTRSVLVLEKEGGVGRGTSSRNSEVVHAGIYYPAGSLKARLCTRGNQELYKYCERAGIAHRQCGKLIVATDAAQHFDLGRLAAQAAANGVQLQWLQPSSIAALEPEVTATAALWSPTTGIVDSHAFMLALQGEAESNDATVCLHTTVSTGKVLNNGTVSLRTADGTELLASLVINCAGLTANAVAGSVAGLPSPPQLHYAKGNYFALAAPAPFKHLVYPAPEQAGLGVHATIDLGGQVRFGPDVEWLTAAPQRDSDYAVSAERAQSFYSKIRRYWPGLPDGALVPDYSGVRPKLQGSGEPAKDFYIRRDAPGWVNCFAIESPGLTASLAIGDYVAQLVRE